MVNEGKNKFTDINFPTSDFDVNKFKKNNSIVST